MHKPKILLTGATGKTGSATALLLLKSGYPVRAFAHRADGRSDALRAAGAEIFVGSMEDPIHVRDALVGVQRAYFCAPLEPGILRKATTFAVAAQEAKLEVVVVLSQWLVDATHLSVHAREKYLMGRVFEWAPELDSVTINPGWFADNYMTALDSISQFGVMALPLGSGLNAPPSNEDIARVVAGALVHPELHIGKSYRPTGPKLLSPEEIASIFGKILGRKVQYSDAPLNLFLKFARAIGLSDFLIVQLHSFLLDYQRGSFGIGAPTNAVLEVGGAEPESFDAIARRYVTHSPFFKRTPSLMAAAAWRMAKAIATPAPDLEKLADRMGLPKIAHGNLAADSPTWRASHG